jgi:formate dehydrogenase subunit gamma
VAFSVAIESAPLPPQFEAVLQQLIDAHRVRPGPLLELLQAIQAEFGWVPQQAIQPVAKALNLGRAEVFGVLSFYHTLRTTPPGRHVLQLCRAESCQAMGGEALAEHVRTRLGIDWHETSADGAVTLLPVYCLGQCACSPAMRLDDAVHGRLTPARIDRLLAALDGDCSGEGAACA